MKYLLDKIKNQSTFIIIVLLVYTYLALKEASSFASPVGLSGFATLFLSIFLTLENYLSIKIGEEYKDIINEFKGIINNMKSQQRFTREHYSGMLTESNQKKDVPKDYTPVQEEQTSSN